MASIYFSPSGNDTTGTGTEGNPYLTLSKAHTSASSGDTLIAMPGSYTAASQTFSKAVTLQGQTKDANGYPTAIFTYGGSVTWTFSINGSAVKDITVDCNLTQGLGWTRSSTSITPPSIEGCHFVNMFGSGGQWYRSGCITLNEAIFNGCVFRDNWNPAAVSSSSIFLCNNGALADSKFYVRCYNCTFFGNQSMIVGGEGMSGIVIDFVNCIFQSTAAHGTIGFYNTTFATITVTRFDNNLYYLYSSTPSGDNNVNADAKFVDEANFNVNLRPDSPAFDAGASTI